MTLRISALDVRRVNNDYFHKARTNVIWYIGNQHPEFIEGLDDHEIRRRVEYCINVAVSHDFVSLGALRYFTFLAFFFSPRIFRNRKVQTYLKENRNGDIGLGEMIYQIPPVNWYLLRGKNRQEHWDQAIRQFSRGRA